MPDVYLLTDGSEGTTAVPDLTLTFLDTGIALDKADGEHVWSSPWDQLEEMSPVNRSELPDGRPVSSSSSSNVRAVANIASCLRPTNPPRRRRPFAAAPPPTDCVRTGPGRPSPRR